MNIIEKKKLLKCIGKIFLLLENLSKTGHFLQN